MTNKDIIRVCDGLTYWTDLFMFAHMYPDEPSPATLPEIMEQIDNFYNRLKEEVGKLEEEQEEPPTVIKSCYVCSRAFFSDERLYCSQKGDFTSGGTCDAFSRR